MRDRAEEEAEASRLLRALAAWPEVARQPDLWLRPLRGTGPHRPWAVGWRGRPRAVLRPALSLPPSLDRPEVWGQLAAAGAAVSRPWPGVAPAPEGLRLWTWLPGRAGPLGGPEPRARALGRLLAQVHGVRDGRGRSLVHGDPSPGNLVWRRNGREPGLIDWEFAHFGDPSADLATLWASLPAAHAMEGPAAAAAWNWLAAVAEGYRAAGGRPPRADRLVQAARDQLGWGARWLAQAALTGRRRAMAGRWLDGLGRALDDPRTPERLVRTWGAA